MNTESLAFLCFIIIVFYLLIASVGCMCVEEDRTFRHKVNPQSYIRWILWPITLVLMLPLLLWLCVRSIVKFIVRYLAGIGSIYKENR